MIGGNGTIRPHDISQNNGSYLKGTIILARRRKKRVPRLSFVFQGRANRRLLSCSNWLLAVVTNGSRLGVAPPILSLPLLRSHPSFSRLLWGHILFAAILISRKLRKARYLNGSCISRVMRLEWKLTQPLFNSASPTPAIPTVLY